MKADVIENQTSVEVEPTGVPEHILVSAKKWLGSQESGVRLGIPTSCLVAVDVKPQSQWIFPVHIIKREENADLHFIDQIRISEEGQIVSIPTPDELSGIAERIRSRKNQMQLHLVKILPM